MPEKEDAGQPAIGVVDLLRDLGRVGVAVVAPDHGLEGEGERAPGGETGGGVGSSVRHPAPLPARPAMITTPARPSTLAAVTTFWVKRPALTPTMFEPVKRTTRSTPEPPRALGGPAQEPRQVVAGHRAHRGDGRGIDEPLDPAHHEGGAAAIGLPRVDVLPSRLGVPGRELREDEGAQQADRSPEHPGHEGQAGPPELRRHQARACGRCRRRRRCPRPWPGRPWS